MLVKYKAPKYCKDKLLEVLTNSDNADKYKELLINDKIAEFILAVYGDYCVEVCDQVIAALCEVFGVTKTLEYSNGLYDKIFSDILGRYFDANDSVIILPDTAKNIGYGVITAENKISGIYFPSKSNYKINIDAFEACEHNKIILYFEDSYDNSNIVAQLFDNKGLIKLVGVAEARLGVSKEDLISHVKVID